MEEFLLTAKDYTIKEYLENTEMFIIPRYQRSYAWEKKNIVQLLNDIENEDNYYIGNIIATTWNTEEKEIVDGQQRIISIFIILMSLFHSSRENVLKYITNEGVLKINIEKRIENQGLSVMKAILDNKIPSTMKKYNEVKRFNDIRNILKDYSEDRISLLERNLLNAKIVEIKFSNAENQAHEMFVNLNTKGKPLQGIEIIKSHLFKYLLDSPNSDYYKEEWYSMLNAVGNKYHGKYLQNVALLLSKSKAKKNEKESLNFMLQKITDEASAKEVFSFMASDTDETLYKVYSAVKNHDLTKLKEYIGHESEYSLDSLDELWKMFKLIKFEQFDIVMVALLYLPTNLKKAQFAKDYLLIAKFLKLVLLYQIHNSVHRVSPSSYTNRFDAAAIDIMVGEKTLREIINKLIDDLKIGLISKDQVISGIKDLKCSGEKKSSNKSRDLKIAKCIIQMVDGNYMEDLKAEHFICESKEVDIVYKIGNIIPVIKDRYGHKDIENKLKMYEQDAEVNVSIKNFLKFKPTKDNFSDVINERTEKIAEEFWNIFEGLRNEKSN